MLPVVINAIFCVIATSSPGNGPATTGPAPEGVA